MYIPFLVSLLAVFLTYLQKYKFKYGLKISMILVTMLSAIRLDYGTDYQAYYNKFLEHSFISINEIFIIQEPIWFLLDKVFSASSFYVLVAFISILSGIIYYMMINKYVDKKYQWLALFIYLFDPNIWLLQQSMLRQGLALTLFFSIFSWINERKLIKSIFVVTLCSMIHTSSLALLPFVFLGFIPKNKGYLISSVFIIIYIIAFSFRDFSSLIFHSLNEIDQFNSYYDQYIGEGNTSTFGFGYFLKLLPYIISLYYLGYAKNQINHWLYLGVILYLIAALIIPFSAIIQLINRMGFYFSIFSIIVIPNIYERIKTGMIKNALIIILIFINLYEYFIFISSDSIYNTGYQDYRTIFELF